MRVDSHTQDWQAMRVLIHTHISCRLLVEGSAPKPLFEHRISFCGYAFCERFFVYTRCPVSEHRGRGRESLTPFANMICPKINRDSLGIWDGKMPPRFSPFRDRCERRALLDYFKRRCFHHHVGQPDTPPGVLGFVLILYLMFFQQAAGIHI